MDPSLAGLVGVLVGAVIGLVSSLISNYFAVRREREQRRHDRSTEQETWLRNRLLEIYTNSLHYISHSNLQAHIDDQDMHGLSDEQLAGLKLDAMKHDDEINRERHKWFNLLLIYHPFKHTQEYDSLRTRIREGSVTYTDIMELAADDPRLYGEMDEWELEQFRRWYRG